MTLGNGLSPLARGTPIICFCTTVPRRFIPAGAGNTLRARVFADQRSVYPRWRGEHVTLPEYRNSPDGLSPLARGTLHIRWALLIGERFIPAGAGNTLNFAGSCYPCPVYPRWRGEHRFLVAATRLKAGLSPLARGTRRLFNFKRLKPRFIPAGAGNTLVEIDAKYEKPVYPRWRGEHMTTRTRCAARGGLSPLARGTLLSPDYLTLYFRFIPAGAGNTHTRTAPTYPASVYPRWRGEHAIAVVNLLKIPGLSPLARGTHLITSCYAKYFRFIPAGAGNTLSIHICF